MSSLKFLGNGAAFHFASNNTAAYFFSKDNQTLFLFDCGEKICDYMLKLHLLEHIEQIYVFITHTHSDHIGSLEPLLYYMHYIAKKKMRIFYPNTKKLKKLLILTGIDFSFEVEKVPPTLDGYQIGVVKQKHIAGSYGYFFYGEYSFFYSGDTSCVQARAIKELKNKKINEIYHEVTDGNSPIHTHISKLEAAIPVSLRKKVILMHFSNESVKERALKSGFSLSEVEQ